MVKQLTHGAQKSVVTRWSLALLPGFFCESDLEHHVEKHDLNIPIGQSGSLIMRTAKLASSLSRFLFADTSSSPEIFLITNQYNGDLAFSVRLSDFFDQFDHLSCHFKAVMISDRVHHDESLAIPYIWGFGLYNERQNGNYSSLSKQKPNLNQIPNFASPCDCCMTSIPLVINFK